MKCICSVLSRRNVWYVCCILVVCLTLSASIELQALARTSAAGAKAKARAGTMTLEVTAYSLQGYMADGHWTYWGACAVYPAQFPFGTVIALYNADGSLNQQCTAEDTGGAVGYGHIDLAMPGDEAGAANWGVRYLSAQVLRWGWENGEPPKPTVTIQPTVPMAPTAPAIPKPSRVPKATQPPLVMHCHFTVIVQCFLGNRIIW